MDIFSLDEVIKILKQAPRIGSSEDSPEGSRYIQMSDTLADKVISSLEYYNNIITRRGLNEAPEILKTGGMVNE